MNTVLQRYSLNKSKYVRCISYGTPMPNHALAMNTLVGTENEGRSAIAEANCALEIS